MWTLISNRLLTNLMLLVFAFATCAKSDNGIDVSSYQGSIDWQQVSDDNITFAIARATVGKRKQDSYFTQNWNGMKKYHIKPAAYHFFKGLDTGESQANNIKAALSSTDFDRNSNILAIDVEEAYGLFSEPARDQNADTLHDLIGNLSDFKKIYIYTTRSYWENHVSWSKYDFSKYNLWIAHWTKADTPTIPKTWQSTGCTWWQYSDKGRVKGISGDVDLDRTCNST